jgi:probable addiction module antidote protein
MAITTTRFDPADYLADAEGIVEYLTSAFESEDPAVITDAFGVVARAHGMSALAAETGLTRQSLYKALSEGGNPEFVTILKVARALGIRLLPERIYAPAE